MVKLFVIALIILSFSASNVKALSSGQEQELLNILSTPEGRQALKQGIESWSDSEKILFQERLKKRIEQDFVPNLPMKINELMTWLDLRVGKDRLVLTVQFSPQFINEPSNLGNYFSNFDNYICSTPVNILLMMVGYSIQIFFYNNGGNFIKSKMLSESDCEF